MTTQSFSLTSAEWTELGATPCLLQNISREAVQYVIGSAKPVGADVAAHMLNPVGSTSVVSIALENQKVYARSAWAAKPAQVAFSPKVVGMDRFTAIASFVATLAAPIATGKLVQTLAIDGVKAGDTLVATARTALPTGITLAGEVTALAGKATVAFIVSQAITSLAATPVVIELTRLP